MNQFQFHPFVSDDGMWSHDLLCERWGSSSVVSRGKLFDADLLPAFVALVLRERIGPVTYTIDRAECEIVTLDSIGQNRGVGAALIEAVRSVALESGSTCIRLITSNDNLKALKFYQKRGFRLVALHRDAVSRSRAPKPEIPMTGNDGIPIRDELELPL